MVKALIVGCGGPGTETVSQMRAQYDVPALTVNAIDADVKIQLRQNPDADSFRGRKEEAYSSTLAHRDEIMSRLSGFSTVVAVGSLGGSGPGVMYAISKLSKDMGANFISAVTLPFAFETDRRTRAENELENVIKFSDRAIVLDMQTFVVMKADEVNMRMLIGSADLMLSKAVRTVARLAGTIPFFSTFPDRVYAFSYGREDTLADSSVSALSQPLYPVDPVGAAPVVCADATISPDDAETTLDAVAEFTGSVPEIIPGTDREGSGALVFIPCPFHS